ncbi:hypothetical protein RFI_04458 [Reticulomyxa filosa]|uniref:Kinesin motor domain-containing protein n=1 Tax=Reticulomyxa filosa TaxID=46433 RepID=X6P280_RETFI|nr:hypothetical protein RFI_04458 [Reticulomyxa filosa]|eukprot:ETO32660.1 hypothetical protein RFI_04458 [Reticulomyxa filosa]
MELETERDAECRQGQSQGQGQDENAVTTPAPIGFIFRNDYINFTDGSSPSCGLSPKNLHSTFRKTVCDSTKKNISKEISQPFESDRILKERCQNLNNSLSNRVSNRKRDINVGKNISDEKKEKIMKHFALSHKWNMQKGEIQACLHHPPNIMIGEVEVGRGKKTPGSDWAQKNSETIDDDIQIIAPENRAQTLVTSNDIPPRQQPPSIPTNRQQQKTVDKWLVKPPIKIPPKKRPESRGRRSPSKKNYNKIINLDDDNVSQLASTSANAPPQNPSEVPAYDIYPTEKKIAEKLTSFIQPCRENLGNRHNSAPPVSPTLHKIPISKQQHQHPATFPQQNKNKNKHVCIDSYKQYKSDLEIEVASELKVDGININTPKQMQSFCRLVSQHVFDARNTYVKIVDEKTISTNLIHSVNGGDSYTFNKTFPPETSNVEFFEQAINSNIEALTQGHSSTIYSYGASGTGKSQLIAGDASEESIQCSILFQAIDAILNNCQATSFAVSISAIEFYGTNAAKTKAFDLLDHENALASTIDEKKGRNINEYAQNESGGSKGSSFNNNGDEEDSQSVS